MKVITGRTIALILTAVAVLALSACGGEDDDAVGGEGEALTSVQPLEGYPYPVQYFDDITPQAGGGQRHMPAGETFDYNSNPPTNGKHTDLAAPWGVSDLAVLKETAVHNLEHAGVVVWYNCNGGPAPLSTDECTMLRNSLAAIVQPRVAAGEPILMTPYPDMDQQIALTSWQVLDAFDGLDEERIEMFIDTFTCYVDIEGFCG